MSEGINERPELSEAAAQSRASVLRSRAESYIALSRHDAAIADLTESIALVPDNARAWRLRGESHRIIERHEAARPTSTRR